MLMRFSISNFMSFGYKEDTNGNVIPTEYHLYAGKPEQHIERVIKYEKRKILKFSSIYGANASGKTNLIKAIDAGKQIVLNTMKDLNYKDSYCRNHKVNIEKPTYFEYEFTLENRCFAYGFQANLAKNQIISEWLYELDSNTEKVIFERIVESNQYYFDESCFAVKENIEQFHFFMKDANRINNTLLLHEIERRNMEEQDFKLFRKIYQWFRYKLIVIYPETQIGDSFNWFNSDNEKLVNILQYLDTGITNYSMRKINEVAFKEYFPNEGLAERFLQKPAEVENLPLKGILNFNGTLFELDYTEEKTKIEKLMFQHGLDETSYEYGEESDGTQRLIELLDIILNDDDDKVFVIDELDRSLHPQMTIKFVETFLKFSKNKTTQMIITTHESNLMDLNILRRDEIWFAEKEKDNTTSLYTLEKFKIRYDKVVSKNYLAGRYGAVPVFKDFEYVWEQ